MTRQTNTRVVRISWRKPKADQHPTVRRISNIASYTYFIQPRAEHNNNPQGVLDPSIQIELSAPKIIQLSAPWGQRTGASEQEGGDGARVQDVSRIDPSERVSIQNTSQPTNKAGAKTETTLKRGAGSGCSALRALQSIVRGDNPFSMLATKDGDPES